MKYVNIIRRIDLLNKAMDRTPDDDRHEDIMDAIWDKRKALIKELKGYIKGNDTIGSKAVSCRRHQVKLACKLLGVDYHTVVV